jgi:hypothetical protein
MICPFCQAEIDPAGMSCGRCGAIYPGGGAGAVLGLRVRTFALAFVLLLITSLIMVDCVLHRLPGSGGRPDMKSADAQRTLLMMRAHQQASENAAPPPLRR